MNIVVFCGSSAGHDPAFQSGAVTLGQWIAQQGHTLVYGGTDVGLMGLTADAVLSHGGKVTGVLTNVELIQCQRHAQVTTQIETGSVSERKAQMVHLADAYMALPGGVGTLDEVTEVLALARLRIEEKPCILLNINGYYDPFKKVLDGMLQEGFANPEDFRHLLISDDYSEIQAFIQSHGPSREQ